MNLKPVLVASPAGWSARILPDSANDATRIEIGTMEFQWHARIDKFHCQLGQSGYLQVYLHGTEPEMDNETYGQYVRDLYAAARELAFKLETEPLLEIF